MTFDLPDTFTKRMKELLGEEYADFAASYEQRPWAGLRVNTLKLTPDGYRALSGQDLEQVPWCDCGFYYDGSRAFSKNPLYHAGLYYIQEPSAMFPAQVLPVSKGDRILDMCAAPGGKSTALAAKLQGTGLLVSNDVSASRAKALLKNIEASGIRNSIVLTEDPADLSGRFEQYFDKILIDAPCSGEGMFRKEPSMRPAWEKTGPAYFRKIQEHIVDHGIRMLKPGGRMVYSTCTFSVEENEGMLDYILKHYPDMSMETISIRAEGLRFAHPEWAGADESIRKAVRLWPHHLKGEGHFTALLKKSGPVKEDRTIQTARGGQKIPEEFKTFLCQAGIRKVFDPDRLFLQRDHLSYLPEDMPDISGLRVMRTGWYLGCFKKKRFEPSGSFARALTEEECGHFINLDPKDPDAVKYLKCETLQIDPSLKPGWYIVAVGGHALGWGKVSGGTLKNKYPSGWRWM